MQRVVYVPDSLNNNKYVLREEYNGFGVYQRKTPTGYFVSQDWLVYNGKVGAISESYNRMCKEEMLDLIDTYNEKGSFGKTGFKTSVAGICGIHPNNKSVLF